VNELGVDDFRHEVLLFVSESGVVLVRDFRHETLLFVSESDLARFLDEIKVLETS